MPLPENAVENAVAKLDGIADDLMKKSGIPGMAVAVVHGGKTIYAKGFGVKDIRQATAATIGSTPTPCSSWRRCPSRSRRPWWRTRSASNAIGWDTPIVSKLPWFALSDPAVTKMVSIGDMFSHRSGLPDHAGDMLEDLGYDRRYVLERLRDQPLDPFRISYAYTNFGLTAGGRGGRGRGGEAVGGPRRRGAVQAARHDRRRATGSTTSEARTNRAIGHIHVDGGYEPLYTRDPDPQAPAGGVSSSVNDMAHWLAMMLADGSYDGKQIVDAKALLPALTPQIVSSPASEPAMRSGFYGFGFNVGTTSARPHGAQPLRRVRTGRRAPNFVILPSADVAIVALTNATPSGVPGSAHRAIRRPRAVRRGP